MLHSKCLRGMFRCMYSKHTKHFSFYPSSFGFGYTSILIPGLPVSLTSFILIMWHHFNNPSTETKGQPVIYTSLSQVEINGDNIIWQGNGWPVSKLYGWVKKWVATAIYALCLWVSQRRGGKKRRGWTRGKEREQDEMGKERWLEIQYKRERIMGGEGEREERQVVYCRYPSKTNLYCIKISRW